jgi:hypothetical protein
MMAAKVRVEAEFEAGDAQKGLSDLDKAVVKLIESEKKLATQKDAEAKFKSMTDAEKDAAVAAAKLSEENAKLAKEQEKLAEQAQKLADASKNSGIGMADLKAGFDMASKGAEFVYDKLKAVVEETVAYAEQVRDLGRISGASADQTSRLIQVADDLKVEYSTLEQASKALAKNGIALTTEELAKASDKYLAIADAGERAEYATKTFGRAGLELTKILESGGDALRQMAKEQSGGLVLTEQQVQAARELEKAEDDLGDSFAAVKTMIGNEVIPVLTDLIKFTTEYVFWAQKTKQALIDDNELYPDYLKNAREEIRLRNDNNTARKVLLGIFPTFTYWLEQEEARSLNLTEMQFKLAKGYYDIADEGTRAAEAHKNNVEAIKNAIPNYSQLAIEESKVAEAARQTAAGFDEFASSLGAASLVPSSFVGELTAKYGALSQALIYSKLAAGMSKEGAMALGIEMGIFNATTITAIDALDSLNARYPVGTRLTKEYAGQASALAAAIAKLQDKSITITTYYKNNGTPSDNSVNPNGAGGPGDGSVPVPESLLQQQIAAEEAARRAAEAERERLRRLSGPSSTNGTEQLSGNTTININGWTGDAASLAAEIEKQKKWSELTQ